MAEEQDQSQKTEEPTERKLQKARERGQVVRSREVNNFFMLMAIALGLVLAVPYMLQQLLDLMGGVFTAAGTLRPSENDLLPFAITLIIKTAVALTPLALIFLAFAYGGGIIQTGPLWSAESMKPTLSKISVMKGFKRLFSLRSVVEFLKSTAKMIIIGVVLGIIIYRHRQGFILLSGLSMVGFAQFIQQVFLEMVLGVLAITALLAIIDYLYQRFEYMKENRMSKQEIKDEVKDTMGDPHIRQRQREIRLQRARLRMMEEIPKAQVVVTNPTHYAVALKYNREEDRAPKVVAMGADNIALKIRERAEEYDIPLVEDPPLARALYAQAELGQEIPLGLFEAVAQVISYVLALKQGRQTTYKSTLPEAEPEG